MDNLCNLKPHKTKHENINVLKYKFAAEGRLVRYIIGGKELAEKMFYNTSEYKRTKKAPN